MLVTPEAAPLELFGPRASEAVGELLAHRGLGLFTSSYPSAYRDGELSLSPAGRLRVERVVTLPRIEGRKIKGLPPACTDSSRWTSTAEAGPRRRLRGRGRDHGTDQAGGLAAQLADVVASQIDATRAPPWRWSHSPGVARMRLTGERATPAHRLRRGCRGGVMAADTRPGAPSKIAGRPGAVPGDAEQAPAPAGRSGGGASTRWRSRSTRRRSLPRADLEAIRVRRDQAGGRHRAGGGSGDGRPARRGSDDHRSMAAMKESI